MITSRKPSTGSIYIKKKKVSQYEHIMKRFTAKKHKEEQCKFEDVPPSSPHTSLKFPTGSSYEGAYNSSGMNGYGEYTFPNGAVYRGEFQDGMFHGIGELIYNEGPEAESVIRGTWENGELTDRKILFNGTLAYKEDDWKYLKLPDRRFGVEFDEDLAIKTCKTAEDPPREIPTGFYDTGDGFYDTETKIIYKYENLEEVKRAPSKAEQKWILENCRTKPLGVMGPRPFYYETWMPASLERAPPPQPSFITDAQSVFFSYKMKCSKKHFLEKPIIIKTNEPCTCQGLCLMREFRKKHEDKCKTVEAFGPTIKTKVFTTGSCYEGDWTPGIGMHGFGVYTFPDGVVYEGEFREGVMHGKGELTYQTKIGKAIVRGVWKEGILTKRTFLFDDGTLEYENDWQYCKMPDRRYSKEYADGLQPGGRSFHTAYQPPKTLSEGCYDTADGLYDRKTTMIYDYDDNTRIIRNPSVPEKKWIKENCRVGDKPMTMGPRPDLYEKYVEPTVLLEPNLPPAAKYRDKSAIGKDSKIDFWPEEVYKKAYVRAGEKYHKPISTVIDSAVSMVIGTPVFYEAARCVTKTTKLAPNNDDFMSKQLSNPYFAVIS